MEEEVLDKYKVEESKREAFRGWGAPPWNEGGCAKTRNTALRKWGEDCWARIFSLFREYNLQRRQSKQEESTEEEEMKQQQRMVIMKDLIRKIRSKGRMDAKSRWWVSELLAAECEKAWIHTGWEDILCRNGVSGWRRRRKKDEKVKDGGNASAQGGAND